MQPKFHWTANGLVQRSYLPKTGRPTCVVNVADGLNNAESTYPFGCDTVCDARRFDQPQRTRSPDTPAELWHVCRQSSGTPAGCAGVARGRL
jgi:hypothetical protein